MSIMVVLTRFMMLVSFFIGILFYVRWLPVQTVILIL